MVELNCFSVICISVLIIQLQHCKAADKLEASTLKNSKTGESFTNELVTRLLDDLLKISQGYKKPWVTYYSSDIAAIDAIVALQNALFDLSAYFATNSQGFSTTKYLPGVALEYSTTRCDTVASNKFPRSISKLPLPWKNYADHLYYYADCRKNATDISKGSYSTLHPRGRRNVHRAKSFLRNAITELQHKRKRRSIIYNDPAICGSNRMFQAISGNLTYPTYGNYSALKACTWQIRVPVKYAVAIMFDYFDLEYDRKCYYDSVEFFDGSGTNAKSLGKFCGTTKPIGIKSSMNTITIKIITDDTIAKRGFSLRWNLTAPTPPHPGFLATSNILVDQIGPPPKKLQGFSFVFNNPKTCGLTSNDVYCYFQYQTTIISKIIATATVPEMKMNGQEVEVIFEHVIDLKSFPTLYNSKIFCMSWNTTIPFTDGGAWSRYGGKLFTTDLFKTVCRYEKPGIFAVIAEAPFVEEPTKFRFTGSFYAGILFAIIWIVILLGQWAFSRRINVPEWLNFNQTVALLLFLGIVLSGLTLDFKKDVCSLLAFLLYYFGLGVFFWQFLKAAQVSGKFDDFFAKGRNEYIFYFILGWTIPIFIAGMAAGATFYQRSETESCWLAMVGGSIWGYTSPTYFLVLGNLYMLYRAARKTKKNKARFNHPALRKRLSRDAMQVIFFIATWVFGILCILDKKDFLVQYLFCISLTLSVILISLGAKQRRPGFQKMYYPDLIDKNKSLPVDNLEDIAEIQNEMKKRKLSKYLSMKAFRKWRRFKKFELKLSKSAFNIKNHDNIGYERHTADGVESRSDLKSPSLPRSPSSMRSTPSSDDNKDDDNRSQLSSSDRATFVSRPSVHSRVKTEVEFHYRSSEPSQASLNEEQSGQDFKVDDEIHDSSVVQQSHESLRHSFKSLRESPKQESRTPLQEDVGSLYQDDQYNEYDNEPDGETASEQQENFTDQQQSTVSIEQQSPEQYPEIQAANESNGEEEETNPMPVFTINAFGATPDNSDAGLQIAPPSSRLPSRAISDRPVESDVMSVCSLGDEDDPENAEDDEKDKEQDDLYDISMY